MYDGLVRHKLFWTVKLDVGLRDPVNAARLMPTGQLERRRRNIPEEVNGGHSYGNESGFHMSGHTFPDHRPANNPPSELSMLSSRRSVHVRHKSSLHNSCFSLPLRRPTIVDGFYQP